MEYDMDKVDMAVLALLYLTSSQDKFGTCAWKGIDVNIFDRLHQKGFIGDPRTNTPTVFLTEEGARLSKDLFFKQFSKHDNQPPLTNR